MNMYKVVVDYNNIYIVHYYCYMELMDDDNKMLIDHRDTLLKDYNNNYSHRMIDEVENNNIEVEEDDTVDNTLMNDETVELDKMEWLLSYLINRK